MEALLVCLGAGSAFLVETPSTEKAHKMNLFPWFSNQIGALGACISVSGVLSARLGLSVAADVPNLWRTPETAWRAGMDPDGRLEEVSMSDVPPALQGKESPDRLPSLSSALASQALGFCPWEGEPVLQVTLGTESPCGNKCPSVSPV